jgi:hypothetical protein
MARHVLTGMANQRPHTKRPNFIRENSNILAGFVCRLVDRFFYKKLCQKTKKYKKFMVLNAIMATPGWGK